MRRVAALGRHRPACAARRPPCIDAVPSGSRHCPRRLQGAAESWDDSCATGRKKFWPSGAAESAAAGRCAAGAGALRRPAPYSPRTAQKLWAARPHGCQSSLCIRGPSAVVQLAGGGGRRRAAAGGGGRRRAAGENRLAAAGGGGRRRAATGARPRRPSPPPQLPARPRPGFSVCGRRSFRPRRRGFATSPGSRPSLSPSRRAPGTAGGTRPSP